MSKIICLKCQQSEDVFTRNKPTKFQSLSVLTFSPKVMSSTELCNNTFYDIDRIEAEGEQRRSQ